MKRANGASGSEDLRSARARAGRAAVAAALAIGVLASPTPAASQPAPSASPPDPAAPPPSAAGDPQGHLTPPPGYVPPPGYGQPGYGQPGYPPPGYGPPGYPPPPPWYQQPYGEEAYKAAIRAAEDRLDQAEARDDEEEVKRIKAEIKALKRAMKEEQERTTERYSTGMMVGGIVMSSLGGVGLLVAGVLGLSAGLSSGTQEDRLAAAALTTLGFSVAFIGAGIPLAVVGGRKVQKEYAAAQPILLVGPTGGGLRWQF